ncbi:sperm-specific sodium:proton exchanger-like [Babylonia areolata]|uniref:sperm-specific sodium:proton exchanger-like n=1 Tax=Babylonia areolata TaxID=304850 RepID=UPI003FD56DFD
MSPNKTYPDDPDVGSEDLILRLLLLFAIFILGAVIQFVTNLVNLGLPYTVLVFVLGMLMGLTGKQKFEMGPHLMLNSFLPILIFDGAFAMDVFVLRKVFWQALFLAGPGLVVITGLTALVAQPLMGSEDWGWKESILFGSILSATDPVAVVALLKELGASPLLSLLIEGESLLNDGTAMVAFTVVYNVIIGAETLTGDDYLGGFMRFAVGGPVFGYFMAMLCLLWLKNTFNDPLSEIAATFVSAFLTFFVSENFLHVSGVLAVVTLGVVLSSNRTSISPEVETFLHSFWEVLAYLANTLIFFLVGMIVMHLITGNKSNPWDFVFIFIIYISINSISNFIRSFVFIFITNNFIRSVMFLIFITINFIRSVFIIITITINFIRSVIFLNFITINFRSVFIITITISFIRSAIFIAITINFIKSVIFINISVIRSSIFIAITINFIRSAIFIAITINFIRSAIFITIISSGLPSSSINFIRSVIFIIINFIRSAIFIAIISSGLPSSSISFIRALVIIMFTPLLKRMGYKLPWQFIAVSSWSGLRGAVGLALALMVYETPEKEIPKQNVSFRIFLHLCGIVFLTLVINATTISKMLALLGMSDISDARREAMATSLSVLGEIKDKTMSVWMTDRFLSDVDWGLVDRYCTLREPWDLTQDEDEEKKLRVWAVCPHCAENVPYQPTTKEMQDMRNEAILRLLKAQKLSYWRQFEHGMLSVMAVRTLQELCEAAADVNGQYLNVGGIKGTWQTTTLTKVRRPSLKEILTCRWLIVSVAVVLYLVLDSVVTVASVTLILDEKPSSDIRISIIISDCLWGLMVLYSIVRLAVLKRAYVQTVWFWLSCLIFVAGAVDLVLCEYFLYLYYPFSPHQAKMVVLVLIGIRVFQNLHALEALVPCLILVLEKREVRRLSHGYDTGRGFVMGEEEIRSRIDHMADRKDIVEELRVHCDAAKMDILKCLGLMQKDNPEVAMGVKTRQAIRSVLNNLRDEIHVLLQDGLLEEAEGIDLAGLVESKMKKLLTAPPKVPLPSTEKILQNVPWVADNKDLILFIQSRAKFDSFEYGDVIMRQDEPTTGVSIILSGLVKLELVIPQPVDSPDAPPKFKTRVLDFLTAGNVLGELGVLTGNRRSATVKCETGVQLLSITLEDIQEAFDKFSYLDPPLKYRLWRLSAIRICTSIFLDQPAFHWGCGEKILDQQILTKDHRRLLAGWKTDLVQDFHHLSLKLLRC